MGAGMDSASSNALGRARSGFWDGAWGSVLAVGSGVGVGLLATLFLEQIHAAWPLSGWRQWQWNAPAVVFWAALLVFVMALGLRERRRLRVYRLDRQALREDILAVRDVAQVMPPKDYLEKSAELFWKASRETEVLLAAVADAEHKERWREDVNRVMRAVLEAIINLARIFDAPHGEPTPVYRASILWIRELADAAPGRSCWEHLWKAAAPLAPADNAEQFFASVDRLLVLDVNLTTNSITLDQPEPDDVEALVLGYTEPGGEHANINLPGAPEALARSGLVRVEDAHDTPDLLRAAKREFGAAGLERVRRYCVSDGRVRSTVSMQIVGLDLEQPDAVEEWVPAVLSICRDTPGILKSDERAMMFRHEILPFLALLSRLCRLRSAMDRDGGQPFTAYTALCRGQKEVGPNEQRQDGTHEDFAAARAGEGRAGDAGAVPAGGGEGPPGDAGRHPPAA